MDIKERTYQFIKHKKLTVKRFEEICELSNGYISSMRKGFGSEKLNNVLLKFPELSRDWLVYGEGPMLVEASTDDTKDKVLKNEETRPRLPVTVAAGSPHGFGAGISLAECEQIPVIKALPPYDFTIIITGDSMEPEYKGGDEIAIKKVKDIIQWGGVYLVDTADGAFIKRLYDDGERFRCVSYNPEYPDFYVEKEAVFGVYKVVGLIRF